MKEYFATDSISHSLCKSTKYLQKEIRTVCSSSANKDFLKIHVFFFY